MLTASCWVGGWSTSDYSGLLKDNQYTNSDGRTSKLHINIAWPLCHRNMKENKYSSQSFCCLLAYFGTLSAIPRKKTAAVQTFCLMNAELIIQNGWNKHKLSKWSIKTLAWTQEANMNLRSRHSSLSLWLLGLKKCIFVVKPT